ncbi:MAG: hypothetical protein PVJ73_20405 [Acidobacteriota bacterium]
MSALDSKTPFDRRPEGRAPAGPGLAGTPGAGQPVHILGVDYVHTGTPQGGDLYLTEAGLSRARHLQPENWYERHWFRTHREVLRGTGAAYVVPTRPVGGESLGLVVKFNRVGEQVPIETRLIKDLLACEFNGPFEEFALVEELRRRGRGDASRRIRTQVPLAIYVPPEKTQPSQSGRFQWRIDRAIARHPGVALDILRDYIMVYSWLPGVDASEACEMGLLTDAELQALTARATEELSEAGFTVLDMKDAHVIVRLASATELERRDGQIEHSVIDYELMARTTEYETEVQEDRRRAYVRRRREVWCENESSPRTLPPIPAHLDATRILGVDYIHGRTESTGGALWVVGRDPSLFDLFLPERWRTTPQLPLPPSRETCSTESKDHIRLVWRVSSVGERPEVATCGAAGFRLLAHGVNSPFEEFALAHWLHQQGVPTVLPLAIYRTGHHSLLPDWPYDTSRYKSHEDLRMPDGAPVLEMRRNYITLWEQWHGPDPRADEGDLPPYLPLDAARAVEERWLAADEAARLVTGFRTRLLSAGVEALNLLPAHLLVTRGDDGSLRRDETGAIAARLCDFQFLRGTPPPDLGAG